MRIDQGNANMKHRIFVTLPFAAAVAFAPQAKAGAVNFALGGDGNVSIVGTLTVAPDPSADTGHVFGTPANLVQASPTPPMWQGVVDPANALAVTGITGFFSDAALGITNAKITGLVLTDPQPHFDADQNIPYSFGWYPALPTPVLSYDNLFYSGGLTPSTCIGVPGGGYFDNYGVMFTLADGTVVDMYSNGGSGGPIYGAAVLLAGSASADYTSGGGLMLNAPEPSTWAMMVLGFAGLGFAGYRSQRKSLAAA
jgi:hypothetical protein